MHHFPCSRHCEDDKHEVLNERGNLLSSMSRPNGARGDEDGVLRAEGVYATLELHIFEVLHV
jgi:hypothetical protein